MGDLCVAFLCGVVAIRSARNGSTEASIRAGVEEEGRSPSTRLLIEGLGSFASHLFLADPERIVSCTFPRPAYPRRRGDRVVDFFAATAQVRLCAGFRTPAALISPQGPMAGVRKASRHEIASGGSGPSVPREDGAAKKAMEIWARWRC